METMVKKRMKQNSEQNEYAHVVKKWKEEIHAGCWILANYSMAALGPSMVVSAAGCMFCVIVVVVVA